MHFKASSVKPVLPARQALKVSFDQSFIFRMPRPGTSDEHRELYFFKIQDHSALQLSFALSGLEFSQFIKTHCFIYTMHI